MNHSDFREPFAPSGQERRVPDVQFWRDLSPSTAQSFCRCYTQQELDVMPFPDHLYPRDRWRLLLVRLLERWGALQVKYARSKVWEADHATWIHVQVALYAIYSQLNDYEPAISILQEIERHGTQNEKMVAKSMRAQTLSEMGNYAAAEKLGRESLEWLNSLPHVGPVSAAALSCQRRILWTLAKQGKTAEVVEMHKEITGLLSSLTDPVFEQFRNGEQLALAETMRALEED